MDSEEFPVGEASARRRRWLNPGPSGTASDYKPGDKVVPIDEKPEDFPPAVCFILRFSTDHSNSGGTMREDLPPFKHAQVADITFER